MQKINIRCNPYQPPYIPPLILGTEFRWGTYGVIVKIRLTFFVRVKSSEKIAVGAGFPRP
jgi:hypothetical protein